MWSTKRTIVAVIIIALLSVGAVAVSRRHHQPAAPATLPPVAQRAVWEWRSPTKLTTQATTDELKAFHASNINTVYLYIGDYLNDYELPDSAQKTAKLNDFKSALKSFVQQASAYDIKVHGLAGDTTWGFPDYAYIPNLFVDYVHQYNASLGQSQQLHGLQFDIETYNDKQYKVNHKAALQNYLNSVQTTVKHYQVTGDNFMLGYTIPYWYDNENGNVPPMAYQGTTAPPAYHLFTILNQITNGYVAILDYRNTATGKDGAVFHAQNEVHYTAKHTPNVKVVIGQETTDVQPAKITYYGRSRNDLYTNFQTIAKSFQGDSTFYGIAIHDAVGFEQLH